MIITELTKTGTELVFFFDLRILITSVVSSYASNVIVEKAKVARFLNLRHQSKFNECHSQKESSLRMVSDRPHNLVTCYGIYFFTNDQDYVLFLVITIRFFLIPDSLSICSQSNSAGATGRAATELIPGLLFALG
jgi:hypothetical protein